MGEGLRWTRLYRHDLFSRACDDHANFVIEQLIEHLEQSMSSCDIGKGILSDTTALFALFFLSNKIVLNKRHGLQNH